MRSTPPDKNYLDAFLQGARFSLFAMEGTLKGKDNLSGEEMKEVMDQLHDLFRSTHTGLRERWTVMRVDVDESMSITVDDPGRKD